MQSSSYVFVFINLFVHQSDEVLVNLILCCANEFSCYVILEQFFLKLSTPNEAKSSRKRFSFTKQILLLIRSSF